MRFSLRVVVSLLACLLFLPIGADAKGAKAWSKNLDSLTWVANPDVPGAKMAVLWGDPSKGPSGVMQRWPAGTHEPRHHHTASVRGVGISGKLVVSMDDKSTVELTSGSYGVVPGGARHVTDCAEGAECVFLTYILGKADTKFAK